MLQAAPLTQPAIEFREPVDSPLASNAFSRLAVDESARRLLGSSSYLLLRDVLCEHREGALILRGTLPSYFLKQMAQASVACLPHVLEIHNRIEVLPDGSAHKEPMALIVSPSSAGRL